MEQIDLFGHMPDYFDEYYSYGMTPKQIQSLRDMVKKDGYRMYGHGGYFYIAPIIWRGRDERKRKYTEEYEGDDYCDVRVSMWLKQEFKDGLFKTIVRNYEKVIKEAHKRGGLPTITIK